MLLNESIQKSSLLSKVTHVKQHISTLYTFGQNEIKGILMQRRRLTRSLQRARHHRNSHHGLGPVMPNSTRYFCQQTEREREMERFRSARAPAANEHAEGWETSKGSARELDPRSLSLSRQNKPLANWVSNLWQLDFQPTTNFCSKLLSHCKSQAA